LVRYFKPLVYKEKALLQSYFFGLQLKEGKAYTPGGRDN